MSTSTGAYARVLGAARLTIDGADAPPEILWRKHLALLVYLARSPRRARTREHLLGLLWSDRDERQARHSLSEALRVMRRTLGDDAVLADVDQIRLEPGAIAFDTSYAPGNSNWAFTQYDNALVALIAINQRAFTGAISAGQQDATGWTWLIPGAAVVLISILVLAGVRLRLAEYRYG